MIEKLKNISNKKIVIVSITIMIIVLVLGFTYAYWTRTFTQSGVNRNTYDCFDITFKEKVEGITIENGYPVTDEEGMQSAAYEVEITNTCTTAASYNVILNKLNTSTLDSSHIKIAVDNDIRLLSETEEVTSTIENAIEGRIINSGVLAGKDSKTISVRSWMDINTTEEEGSNKVFENKITIEAVATKEKLLAENILKEGVKNNTPDFFAGEPPLNYQELVVKDKQYGAGMISSNTLRSVGTGYTFDINTGEYTLTEVQKQIYDETSIGKYTCINITADQKCQTIYKIKEVDSVTSGSAQYMYVKIADEYKKEVKTMTNENSGLYKTMDDDGDSYYYRGLVENNYVSFANKIWRIIRINGDNSIRLILDDTVGRSKFSLISAAKYTGYTYDNENNCTKANPCTNESGISSTIKEYLDNWYKENLEKYDNYIQITNFCNDTTHNAASRLDASTPNLQCPDTDKTYGGLYKLKIGLLSVDEMSMAGLSWDEDVINKQNYLYKNYNWWTMTPYNLNSKAVLSAEKEFFSINSNEVNTSLDVRPVINLKAKALIVKGEGTIDNPYIIN